jgi:hypothetical protein
MTNHPDPHHHHHHHHPPRPTALFGGALQCLIPSTLADASEFRQVPDHQEVFASPAGHQSLIVEILELAPVPITGAAGVHFADLASDNDAAQSSILRDIVLEHPPPRPSVALLSGAILARKFGKDPPERVRIDLAVIRLEAVATDIVVSINTTEENPENDPTFDPEAALTHLIESFQVNDWGLFAAS